MSEITKDHDRLAIQSVIEIADLVKELEEKWGVSGYRRRCSSRTSCGGDGGDSASEEKTEFDVILTEFGGNKIAVIKEVEHYRTWA